MQTTKISDEGRGTVLVWEPVTICGLCSAGDYIVGHIRDNAGYYQHRVHLYRVHTAQCGEYVTVRGKRVYIRGF